MTRLTIDDIQNIPAGLEAYDETLRGLTGSDLAGIACRTYGLSTSAFRGVAAGTRVGVVPITWGQGAIPGFSETVWAIAAHLGFKAFVTHKTDVAGLSEAAERESDVVMLSDDRDFLAIHCKAGIHVHNSEATGRVFAAGLDMMAGGLAGKKALVVGCGPVVQGAGHELIQRGAMPAMADVDQDKARHAARVLKRRCNQDVAVVEDLQQAFLEHRYILDATPVAGIMGTRHVAGNTLVSAPGVPLGLTPRAAQAASGRLLHDTLQLGVAAMLAAIVKGKIYRRGAENAEVVI